MTTWVQRLLLIGIVCSSTALAWSLLEPVVADRRQASQIARRGFVPRTLFAEDGTRIRYSVFVPHRLQSESADVSVEKWPVLMFLNGAGENGDDGVTQISNNFGRQIWELKGTFPFIAVAPQCDRGGDWDANGVNAKKAQLVLADVMEKYAADPDRIYLTGCSSGGSGVFDFASAFPDQFAAIAPTSAVGSESGAEQHASFLASSQTPVWAIYNGGDRDGVVGFNRAFRESMLRCGASAMVTEYDRVGHDAWNFAFREPALYAWLLRHRLSDRTRKQPEFRLIDSPNDWRLDDNPTWSCADGTIQHQHKDEREFATSELYSNDTFTDFELHFGFRTDVKNRNSQISDAKKSPKQNAAAKPVVKAKTDQNLHLGLMPLDDEDGRVDIAVVSPNLGTGGVFSHTDGRWIAHGDATAQLALRATQWNNIRIRKQGDELSIEVNGWPLTRASHPAFNTPMRICLVGKDSSQSVSQWREIRVRDLSAEPKSESP